MYFHTSLYLSILGTIVPLTLANFDIYADQAIDWNREKQQPRFRIFGGATSGNKLCDFVNKPDYRRWPQRADVADIKFGIRCSGTGCDLKTSSRSIDVLEMNFAKIPPLHWSLYKKDPKKVAKAPNGGFWMQPSEAGAAPGYCFPYDGDAYNCEHQDEEGFIVGSQGQRKFRCITDVVADDINSHKPQDMSDVYPYPDDNGDPNSYSSHYGDHETEQG